MKTRFACRDTWQGCETRRRVERQARPGTGVRRTGATGTSTFPTPHPSRKLNLEGRAPNVSPYFSLPPSRA